MKNFLSFGNYSKLFLVIIISFLAVSFFLRLPVKSHGDNLYYMALIKTMSFGIKTGKFEPVYFAIGKSDMHNYPLIFVAGLVNIIINNTEYALYLTGVINILLVVVILLYFSKEFLKFDNKQSFLLLIIILFLQQQSSTGLFSPGFVQWISLSFNPESTGFAFGLLALTFFEKFLKKDHWKYFAVFILAIYSMCLFDQIMALGFVFVFAIFLLQNTKIILAKLPKYILFFSLSIITILILLKIYPFFDIFDYLMFSREKASLLTSFVADNRSWYAIIIDLINQTGFLLLGLIPLIRSKGLKHRSFILSVAVIFLLFPLFEISPIKISYYWRFFVFTNFFFSIGLAVLVNDLLKHNNFFRIAFLIFVFANILTKFSYLNQINNNYKIENLDPVTLDIVNHSHGTILSDPWTSYRAIAWSISNIKIYLVPDGHFSAPGWSDCQDRINNINLISAIKDKILFRKLIIDNDINLIIIQKLSNRPYMTSTPYINEQFIPVDMFSQRETENYRLYTRKTNI